MRFIHRIQQQQNRLGPYHVMEGCLGETQRSDADRWERGPGNSLPRSVTVALKILANPRAQAKLSDQDGSTQSKTEPNCMLSPVTRRLTQGGLQLWQAQFCSQRTESILSGESRVNACGQMKKEKQTKRTSKHVYHRFTNVKNVSHLDFNPPLKNAWQRTTKVIL